MQQANYLIHPETAVKFLLGLLLSTFLILAVLIPKHNSIYHKSDIPKESDQNPHRVTVLLSGNDVPRLEIAADKAYANGDTLAGDALMSVANTKSYYFYPGK